VLLATLAGGAGAVAMVRSPLSPATKPFLRLSAVVAALLVLLPVTGEAAAAATLPLFLLSAPWEYAAAPVLIHVAFAIGWPHRKRLWSGLVIGWYLVHLSLFIAAVSGLLAGETELTNIVDVVFFDRVLYPAGILTAMATLLVALGSPTRRGSHRRPVSWMFAGVALGFGPMVAATFLPQLNTPIDGAMTPARLAIVLAVFLGLAAMLALPLSNDTERDLKAYSLGQRLLDEPDLSVGLAEVASVLRICFDIEGVAIRLRTPEIEVVDGEVRPSGTEAIAPEAETIDDRRTLVAPIGRVGDPLGEVRLDARFSGAFGRREREWLASFLLPVATTLRARRRESLHETRLAALIKEVLGAVSELKAAMATIPSETIDGGEGVPAPVDASEVLGQLTDGLTSISRRSSDLESAAGEARGKVGTANDLVARGLDGLNALNADIIRLTSWSDEIGLANKAIDNVAFRIDLLANNAALEASRAGEAGKTFAVLAEEIRRLANTTAGSSGGVREAAAALANEVQELSKGVESIQTKLRGAMRDAETGEDAAKRITEITGQLVSQAGSFGPVVDEAYAVAARRTQRDENLTETLERLLVDREQVAGSLANHRSTLERVQHSLEQIAGRSPH
jgi:hypothetical protein